MNTGEDDLRGIFLCYGKGDPGLQVPGSVRDASENRDDFAFWEDQNIYALFSTGNISIDFIETGDIACWIDGEIFLQETDAGPSSPRNGLKQNYLVPGLYDKYGKELIKHIRGFFNLILFDKRTGILHLMNDAMGLRPLYHTEADGVHYFSTRLLSFTLAGLEMEIDEAAVAEYLIFNYPLMQRTFFRDVRLMAPGTVMELNGSKLASETYYPYESLFSGNILDEREAYGFLHESLREKVGMMTPDRDTFGLSLTGGFDGRTVLALVDDLPRVMAYTFGSSVSSEIGVARKVASALGIDYFPILLEKDYFRNHFIDSVHEMLSLSDGMATFRRAHYIYAFRMLQEKVNVVLTGMCGSELLRSFRGGDVLVSPAFFSMLQSNDPGREFDRIISENPVITGVLKPSEAVLEEVKANFNETRERYFTPYDDVNRGFHMFLLNETFRKYFGAEMKVDGHFVLNRSPFLDISFIEDLNRTPFSSAHQHILMKNPVKRKKGQELYAHIIVKSNRKLARMKMNKGYSPHDVYHPLLNFKLFVPYFRKMMRGPQNLLNPALTTRHFYGHFFSSDQLDNPFINSEPLLAMNRSELSEEYTKQYEKLLSLSVWFSRLAGTKK